MNDDGDDDCGNLRCVGLFCNSQACLATSLVDLDMLLQGPKSPTSKRNHPPLAALYGSLVVHYSFGFTAYKAASGGRGGSLRCRTLRTLQKHAKVGQGPCKACRDRPRTLPSMSRSCKASLHILGSHNDDNWFRGFRNSLFNLICNEFSRIAGSC